MSRDLRTLVAADLRLHPRVAYQSLFTSKEAASTITQSLPPLTAFRSEYLGAISIIDWDHRLPSERMLLRIYAYYSAETLAAGNEAFDDRLEEIGARDRYPEFDVPDFDQLLADEAYEVELMPDGSIGRCRLTSAWRRDIRGTDSKAATSLVADSSEFQRVLETASNRPSSLGELEAVSWTPPCESEHTDWTLDVWFLLAFDGRVGTGRSFLVDLEAEKIVAVRDFSVRAG